MASWPFIKPLIKSCMSIQLNSVKLIWLVNSNVSHCDIDNFDSITICNSKPTFIAQHWGLAFFHQQMASAGIPGVTEKAVKYVQEQLDSDLSDDEAEQTFACMIDESMGATLTQWNFFFHSFAISKKSRGSSKAGLFFVRCQHPPLLT